MENKGGILLPLLMVALFWAVDLCSISRADDQYYDYFIIKTSLIKVTDIDGERIVPDVPCQLYSYVAVSEGTSVTYSKDLKLEGKEIMACVAVKHEDKSKIQHLVIGETFDDIKATGDYNTHFFHTIGDMKTYRDTEGTLVVYNGADKDDPARFAMWDY